MTHNLNESFWRQAPVIAAIIIQTATIVWFISDISHTAETARGVAYDNQADITELEVDVRNNTQGLAITNNTLKFLKNQKAGGL